MIKFSIKHIKTNILYAFSLYISLNILCFFKLLSKIVLILVETTNHLFMSLKYQLMVQISFKITNLLEF